MKKIAGVFWGVCLMLMVAVLPVKAQGEVYSVDDWKYAYADEEQAIAPLSLEEDERWGWIFTSFDELKELAARSYDSYTQATYQGEEALVITEDLELPENLSINFWKKVIIPEGVTLTTNYGASLEYGLEVAGTLHLKEPYRTWQVGNELIITGAIINNSVLCIECYNNVTGLENIQMGEEGILAWLYFEGDSETVKQVARTACEDTMPNTDYIIHITYGQIIIDEDITIPENMTIQAHNMTFTEECEVDSKGFINLLDVGDYSFEMKGTMNNDGFINVRSGRDLYMSGTLNNIGEISIYQGGTMTITDEGEYTGQGIIKLYGIEESAIASVVPGLDLSKFEATECDDYWELRMKSSEVLAIESFVTRMYQQCLSRDPDQEGLDGWVGQLENGLMNGAQIAEQFVFSQEMLDKNLSNEEFVNILYTSMMGREADAAGRTGWVNELRNGYMTRSEVTKAFVESVEFTEICTSYGITRGTYDASMAPIEHFVTRFYTLCLERKPDQAGLYGWVNNLKNQYMNGAQIADAFIFSDEFVNKNVSDEKYIELLYNTLLGRPSDANGKAGWVGELQGGHMTREGMMKAFIESTEFTGICESYGITRGSL